MAAGRKKLYEPKEKTGTQKDNTDHGSGAAPDRTGPLCDHGQQVSPFRRAVFKRAKFRQRPEGFRPGLKQMETRTAAGMPPMPRQKTAAPGDQNPLDRQALRERMKMGSLLARVRMLSIRLILCRRSLSLLHRKIQMNFRGLSRCRSTP